MPDVQTSVSSRFNLSKPEGYLPRALELMDHARKIAVQNSGFFGCVIGTACHPGKDGNIFVTFDEVKGWKIKGEELAETGYLSESECLKTLLPLLSLQFDEEWEAWNLAQTDTN